MTDFYERRRSRRNDDDDLAACIERVINQLAGRRHLRRPIRHAVGQYLWFPGCHRQGVQRGGSVLTKAAKTLAKQTVARIQGDFQEFVDGDDVAVFDNMQPFAHAYRSSTCRINN